MDADTAQEVAVVREWYERTAEAFDCRYSGRDAEFWKRFEEDVALQWLGQSEGAVLDLGCGAGRLSRALSSSSARVLGVDISVSMLSIAESRRSFPAVHYAATDATNAALRNSQFRSVISLGMFEYLDDPSPFLGEIYRVLEPGGRVIFTCHNRAPLMMRGWVYAGAKLERLLSRANAQVRRHGAPRVVRHKPERVVSLLRRHGFVDCEFRGFHFAPAVDLFRLASRFGEPLRERLSSAAAGLNRAAGRNIATRRLCSLMMYSARKPR